MYGCVVTNDFGSATSNTATLTVTQLPYDIYPIVDTGQTTCYNNTSVIACPNPGAAFHGQDAQYAGNAPSFTLSGDGLTVLDNITGLTWQRSPDTDGDNDIDASDKLTWTQAQAYPATLNAVSFGGFDDWRLPTIKELYSLIDFRGVDPSGCDDFATCPNIVPFIDTNYFDFAYGDTAAGERIIDSQYASSTLYVSTVDDELLFGVNFADGRIKGYGLVIAGTDKTFLVMCVRGPSTYGTNNFVDNGNGTVTDRSTGLMWTQGDSGVGYNWQAALGYAENLNFAGYTDWRLPSVKELQGILDYTRSPDTTSSAAIDPIFDATPIVNEEGQADWPYYWANTTHANWMGGGESGAYVAFGRGLGYLDGQWQDVHGAGCQRSDFKDGDPADYPFGHGPQGDAIRIFNYVRAVRDTVLSECFGDGDCDDENVCTDDTCLDGTCQHADNTGPCDDGLFCTLTDVCLSGSCTGSGDPCPGQTCDEDSDTCIAPSVPAASQCGLISMLMMVLLGGTMVFMRFGREALGGAGD
ncbi:MAG: DUF1566 domain-containing protein [Phycisphaerae bacterium]|nr:DUF1566 domain-containing protein [Phycisphaerae bacterium]